MAKKNANIEAAIKKSMPGWRVIKKSDVDAVPSPSLAAQQAKLGKLTKKLTKKSKSKKSGRAQFITVAPEGMPARKFQKVLLVKNGKIVAQQG
jgi:hypothetical protein